MSESKPTAPLLPALQPAPLALGGRAAGHPYGTMQQVNKLDIAQRHEQTLAIFLCAARITQGSILGLLGVPARRGTVSARHQRLRVDSLCIEPTPSSRS